MVHKSPVRPETVLLLAGAAALLAAAAWAGSWAYRNSARRSRTAVCVSAVMEDSVPLSGLVLREERALAPAGPSLRYLPAPGERIPAGSVAAIQYETGEEYFRGELLRRLRQDLSLEERGTALSPGEAARILSAAVARRDLSAAPPAARTLRLALAGPDEAAAQALRREIDALEAAGAADHLFLAPASGFFFPDADGWETLSFAAAAELSPRELRYLLAHPPEPPGNARLLTGSSWRFLALTDLSAAARFDPGRQVELLLPGEDARFPARVLSVRTGDGDMAVVTFVSREGLPAAAVLRQTELTAVLARWEGLRLPAAAVREADGEVFVLRRVGPRTERTAVTVLARQGNDVLVAGDSLFPGAEVLLP